MYYHKNYQLGLVVIALLVAFSFGTARASTSEFDRSLIEADWLKQAQSWRNLSLTLTPASQDSLGAVDGVKNGRFGFHTDRTPNPWWQVDLEKVTPISRILVYNRLDFAPGLHNADTMRVLVSDDGEQWTQIHDNAGRHFGGMNDLGPLALSFERGQVNARFVRLLVPSERPVFFHLDEVEIYSFDEPDKNIALWMPTEQSSTSQWSVPRRSSPRMANDGPFPVEEVRDRLLRLAAYLKDEGVDATKIAALERQIATTVEENQKAEYLRLRQLGRQLILMNPLLDFDRLLFVKRFTQQTFPDICLNHMPWVSRPGGDIGILENPFSLDGAGQKVTYLIDGQLGVGHVRGIDLYWEGDRIVFGYARQPNFRFDLFPNREREPGMGHYLRLTQTPIHLFEINVDGSGLRQITDHDLWSDLDPAYLPNGDIVFVSERCGFSLQCNNGPQHDETSCNLFTIRPDGTGLRWLSYNKDGDYMPHVLLDGTIAYCRWEYQERDWATLHSVWTINPDGTGARALFKQHLDDPWNFSRTREIPVRSSGQRKYVSIATGHHTLATGTVCILVPNRGLNDAVSIEIVTPGAQPPQGGMTGSPVKEGGVMSDGGYYMYPWPLSEKFFLVAYTYSNDPLPGMGAASRGACEKGFGLYLIDVFGNKELIYKDPSISSSFPMPLMARTRPPIIPDNTDPTLGDRALITLSDASRGVEGVEQDEIRYIRIAHSIGWPYTREAGGLRYEVDGSGWGLNWAPTVVIGEAPVEADGSASFYVPSGISLYFQLLDAEKQEIKRMRSFISFQPGEARSCVGCHESQPFAPSNAQVSLAMMREPSTPTPPPWGIERPINFLVDIQPVLDRNCVACHDGLTPSAGFDFSGGLMPPAPMMGLYRNLRFDGLNRAYRTIIGNHLVVYSDKRDPASAVAQTRQFGSSQSRLIQAIRGGPNSDHLRIPPGSEDWYRLVTWIDANAQYHDRFVNSRPVHPPYDMPADVALRQTILEVHQRRCADCHDPEAVTRLDWIDLQNPANSRFLTAPLSRMAGGTQRCGRIIYANQNDPDYATLRRVVEDAVERAKRFPRRDVEALLESWKLGMGQ